MIKKIIGDNKFDQTEESPPIILDFFEGTEPTEIQDKQNNWISFVYLINGTISFKNSNGEIRLARQNEIEWSYEGVNKNSEMLFNELNQTAGFKLWVKIRDDQTLNSNHKNYKSTNIQIVDRWNDEGIISKVICNKTSDQINRGSNDIPLEFIYFEIKQGSCLTLNISSEFTAMIYVLDGSISILQGNNKYKLINKDEIIFTETTEKTEIIYISGIENNRIVYVSFLGTNTPSNKETYSQQHVPKKYRNGIKSNNSNILIVYFYNIKQNWLKINNNSYLT